MDSSSCVSCSLLAFFRRSCLGNPLTSTPAQRQAAHRAKTRAEGLCDLRLAISLVAKHQLLSIAALKGMTHRQVIEFLLNKESTK